MIAGHEFAERSRSNVLQIRADATEVLATLSSARLCAVVRKATGNRTRMSRCASGKRISNGNRHSKKPQTLDQNGSECRNPLYSVLVDITSAKSLNGSSLSAAAAQINYHTYRQASFVHLRDSLNPSTDSPPETTRRASWLRADVRLPIL
jgi:hypothetical protein